MKKAKCPTASLYVKEEPLVLARSTVEIGTCGPKNLLNHSEEVGQVNTEATVRVLKKPNRAFGALLGNSASKRKLSSDPKVEIKVEEIKSSVTLPFHSFCGGSGQSEPQGN
ncbi:hypothetical protein FRX31_011837 [Thalictrum thalictroides]|uniref:Uncharacterized protein n=1 Tax=Thalictrum thalictroides TaxID=46969 RepID=A0A7J6WMI1_THATH|nr:hypothetical protein FRX31_011837 [Thalictrum thalictroides]